MTKTSGHEQRNICSRPWSSATNHIFLLRDQDFWSWTEMFVHDRDVWPRTTIFTSWPRLLVTNKEIIVHDRGLRPRTTFFHFVTKTSGHEHRNICWWPWSLAMNHNFFTLWPRLLVTNKEIFISSVMNNNYCLCDQVLWLLNKTYLFTTFIFCHKHKFLPSWLRNKQRICSWNWSSVTNINSLAWNSYNFLSCAIFLKKKNFG